MKVSILAVLAGLALAAQQAMIWFYAPVAQSGPVQKIFYMHLPCSWWALVSFFVVFVASILYLFGRKDVFDRVAGAAAELGVLFASLALVTGSTWARAEWGHWWLWDPKLTTALIMWYVYAGYLVLRNTPMGRDRKALVCAVLGIVAFLDVPLVFFAAKLWGSAHPRRAGPPGIGHGGPHVAHRVRRAHRLRPAVGSHARGPHPAAGSGSPSRSHARLGRGIASPNIEGNNMSATTYIFIANVAVWLGVAGYLAFLGSRSATLEKRLRQIELLGDGHDG